MLCTMIGWFAARATLSPPEAPETGSADLTYEVQSGRVERVLEFTATTAYQRRLLAYGSGDGVVTAVNVRPGRLVASGDRLYSLDEQPVIAVEGVVPSYRDLVPSAVGRDVAQVQRMLIAVGFLQGAADGNFDYATEVAVRSWQEAEGLSVTGKVTRSSIVFVPGLPAKLQLADTVGIGKQLSPGVEAVYGLSAAPRFEIVLSEEQTDLVPLDAPVVVSAGESRWRGEILRATNRGTSELVLTLGKPNGVPLCGEECDKVPAGQSSSYPASITAVPRSRGPIVPASALRSDASGQAFVTGIDGTRIPVTVIASNGGWSVVEGVDEGESLNLFQSADTDVGEADGDSG